MNHVKMEQSMTQLQTHILEGKCSASTIQANEGGTKTQSGAPNCFPNTNAAPPHNHPILEELEMALPLPKTKITTAATIKTLQELRMLSSVSLNCQVTKIVMNSGAQLSEL